MHKLVAPEDFLVSCLSSTVPELGPGVQLHVPNVQGYWEGRVPSVPEVAFVEEGSAVIKSVRELYDAQSKAIDLADDLTVRFRNEGVYAEKQHLIPPSAISMAKFLAIQRELLRVLKSYEPVEICPGSRLGSFVFSYIAKSSANVLVRWLEEDSVLVRLRLAVSLKDAKAIFDYIPVYKVSRRNVVADWVEIVPWRMPSADVAESCSEPKLFRIPGHFGVFASESFSNSSLLAQLWPLAC